MRLFPIYSEPLRGNITDTYLLDTAIVSDDTYTKLLPWHSFYYSINPTVRVDYFDEHQIE